METFVIHVWMHSLQAKGGDGSDVRENYTIGRFLVALLTPTFMDTLQVWSNSCDTSYLSIKSLKTVSSFPLFSTLQ